MPSNITPEARKPPNVPAVVKINGTPSMVKCRLLGLPPELQAIVLSHVTVDDLRRVCLTCSQLRDSALPTLYEDLHLGLPQHRALGLKYTRSISVTDSLHRDYYGLEDDMRSDEDQSDSDGSSFDYESSLPRKKPKSQDLAAIVNSLVRLVIAKVPRNRLRSFKWRHTFPLSPNTITECAQKHPDTFSELGVEYQTVSWSSQASVKSLPKLHSLELGSLVRKPVQFDPSGRPVVSRDFSPDWVGRLIYDNASQLRRLKLGTESCLINSYIENGGGLDHPTQAKTFRKLYANMGGPNEEAQLQSVDGVPKAVITPLCLNSLHLIGLDVSLTLSESFPRIFKFAPLETFYLESCVGSEDLLESLAVSFGSTSIDHAPKIKDFRFRHEESGSILHDALGKFLSSFSGLQSLAILLDGTRDMPHPRCFTHKHGDTLKTLVWDGRSGARTDFGVRTAILASETFVHSQLTYISENCPGLVELGVSIDWRHTYQGVVPSIRNLKLLRTLNIRNVPECPEESIGSPPPILPTEQYARIAATQLMESTVEFEGIVAVPRPIPCSVKLITTGAITYRNHRTVLPVDDDEDLDEELHKYLSPRFFLIKYHPDALGHMKPLLTEVGMGTSYGVEAFEQNLSIFQPYWLN